MGYDESSGGVEKVEIDKENELLSGSRFGRVFFPENRFDNLYSTKYISWPHFEAAAEAPGIGNGWI